MQSLFAISCCAARERDEAADEVVSVVVPASPPAEKEPEDDGVASTVSFWSIDPGEDSNFSYPSSDPTTQEPVPGRAKEAEFCAPVEARMAGDLALVLRKAANILQGGRLSEWEMQWCTPMTVQMHLDARKGDVDKASEILAEALRQRDEFRDVLTFTRQPAWQSDLRVLARGEDGHTCVYFCLKNQVERPSARASLEHIALVLEVAVKQLQQHATTFDVVCDCHGLKISRNLDPRVALGFASLLKHAFRDRLRFGLVVDAGPFFGSLWRVFSPVLPAKTKDKIVMASGSEALLKLSEVAGRSVADAVAEQMRANRSSSLPPHAAKQPTELDEEYVS